MNFDKTDKHGDHGGRSEKQDLFPSIRAGRRAHRQGFEAFAVSPWLNKGFHNEA